MTALATINEATARRAVFNYASREAEQWEDELRRFGALWRDFNQAHFGGKLDEPHVMVGSPASPKAEGSFTMVGGDGLRSLVLIRRTYVDGTFNGECPGRQAVKGAGGRHSAAGHPRGDVAAGERGDDA